MLRIFAAKYLKTIGASSLAQAIINRHQHTQSVLSNDKIYELRTYTIKPQCLKDFLNLTSEEFHLRTSQSKLIGYWMSDLGGLNEVVHIWEYDSLEHRAQVRAGLAVNTEWISRYFAKILPWMSGQQNSIVSVVPGITFHNSEEKGVYQLQSFNYKLNKSARKELKKSSILKSKLDDLLVGAFTTCHGNLNTAVLLWKHPTLTAATQLVNSQLDDEECWQNVSSAYSKVLIPHKVSPLQ